MPHEQRRVHDSNGRLRDPGSLASAEDDAIAQAMTHHGSLDADLQDGARLSARDAIIIAQSKQLARLDQLRSMCARLQQTAELIKRGQEACTTSKALLDKLNRSPQKRASPEELSRL
jgi:hypothetical protein